MENRFSKKRNCSLLDVMVRLYPHNKIHFVLLLKSCDETGAEMRRVIVFLYRFTNDCPSLSYIAYCMKVYAYTASDSLTLHR